MTFEERVLRDSALANGENPDDPEVNARIQKELAEQQEEPEEKLLTPSELNSLYSELICIFENLEKRITKPAQYSNVSLVDLFFIQATNLCLDLIAVDGYIQPKEASALNIIFDINYTVQEYVEIYKERDKNTLLDVQLRTAFVPQAYYVAVAADRAMFGGKDFFTVKVMKFFMELIKTVVVVDGQLDESEGFAIKMFSLAFQNTKPGDSNGFVFV